MIYNKYDVVARQDEKIQDHWSGKKTSGCNIRGMYTISTEEYQGNVHNFHKALSCICATAELSQELKKIRRGSLNQEGTKSKHLDTQESAE